MAAGSVVKLSADVATTVETLQELSLKLKKNEILFSDAFSTSSQSVISAILELNKVRVHTHELLEGETITASALRHKLNSHVSKLQAEAAAAVISARDSNQTRLQELQTKISSMGDEATTLLKKHEILGLHNDLLNPELQQLQNQHVDKVKLLNERMLEKAGMQIVLNETKEQFDSTDSKVASLEEEIASLQEELRKKKEIIGKEREELLKLMDITKVKLSEQYEDNKQLTKDLKHEEYKVVHAELALNDTKLSIEQVEEKIERLLEREEEIKEIIEQQEKEKLSLIEERQKIEEEMKKATEEFSVKKKQGEETINQLKAEVDLTVKESKRLSETYRSIKSEWITTKDNLETIAHSLTTIKDSVNTAKHSLMKESEDGVKLEMEKKELDFRLKQLDETHRVNVQLFKEEVTDLRDRLTRECKTRQTIEKSYIDLNTLIQQQILEQSEMISSLTAQLKDCKHSGDNLLQQRTNLQRDLSNCETNIEQLHKQLIELQQHLIDIKLKLEHQLTTLEDDIAELTDEIKDYTEQLQELEPNCESLESNYTLLSEQYENTKKKMIELKNKRAGVNDTCQRLGKELDKMHIPQDHLRMETLKCRAHTRRGLRTQKKFVDKMETKVRERRNKLEAIIVHNNTVQEASSKLESECQELAKFIESSPVRETRLVNKLEEMKRELEKSWKESIEFGKVYYDRDSIIVSTLSALQEKSSDQMKELSVVSTQFDQEMKCFNEFLSKLSKTGKV